MLSLLPAHWSDSGQSARDAAGDHGEEELAQDHADRWSTSTAWSRLPICSSKIASPRPPCGPNLRPASGLTTWWTSSAAN